VACPRLNCQLAQPWKLLNLEAGQATLPYSGAYETGDYAKQSEVYKSNFAGKEETPESKSALANLYEIIDRMIDGYARAVALAGNDPKFASLKSTWNESLGTWYKFRNGSDAGMSEMVANILTKPLPPLPARRTSL
jgi:hypothetical protein